MRSVALYLSAGGDRRLAALRRFGLSIGGFTIVGHAVLGFEQSWTHPVASVATACAVELLLETIDAGARARPVRYRGGPSQLVDFLLPALITGLAVAMLLYPNQRTTPIVFAAVVAVGSKYLFRVPIGGGWRHALNPSNTGIAATLILFPSVGIVPPYHFTENVSGLLDWIVPLGVLASGLMLNWRLTGKMPLIAGWVGGFLVQAAIRWAVFGAPLVAMFLPVTGLAFMLFTVYMVTDPATTPIRPGAQFAFGLAVAAAYGALVTAHVVFGMFFALVVVSATRGVGLLALLAYRRATRVLAPQPQPVAGIHVVQP
ncbi:MAG TPA: hypothetical protein VHF25_08780 [Nitriliruptorales bacterium]|nr:hypothetical protein [Nitriliruptorales bacterium]